IIFDAYNEEEGAYYKKDHKDVWAKNFNLMACAIIKGESKVALEGLASELVAPGIGYGGIKNINVSIAGHLNNKKDGEIDLTSQSVQNGGSAIITYDIIGTNQKLRITLSNEESTKFIDLLGNPTEDYFISLVRSIPEEESQDAYSQLVQLPECAYNKISTSNIIKYLGWLSSELWTNSDQEVIIIDLLRYASDRRSLYEELRKDPYLLAKTVLSCDGEYRTACVNELVKLCGENWGTSIEAKGQVHLGKVSDSFPQFYMGHDFIAYAKIEENLAECELVNYIGRFPKGMLDWGNVQELQRIRSFNINLLDPVKIYSSVEEQCGMFPAIFALNVSQELGVSEVQDQFANTLNYIGAGSAVKMLAVGNKLQKTVAFTEIIKTGLDEVFSEPSVIAAIKKEDGGEEFLKYYNIVSIGVDVLTIGVDVLENIVKKGPETSKALKAVGKNDAADNVDDLVDESNA
ncbi:MAG: hypothetical protein MI866_22725, partial [Bacteroidales bacterium]|nr:hypothetical protein [Bacteroidales bacterium]